jgi:hypothetical protein
MKNIILTSVIMCLAFLGTAFSQTDGLTHVYVTGPEGCPSAGQMIGTRADGGSASAPYWGYTGSGGPGPSFYNIPWYNSNFYIPCSTTLIVQTVKGNYDFYGIGVGVPITCRGEETKIIGYGASCVFNIELGMLAVGEPGPPPPVD